MDKTLELIVASEELKQTMKIRLRIMVNEHTMVKPRRYVGVFIIYNALEIIKLSLRCISS